MMPAMRRLLLCTLLLVTATARADYREFQLIPIDPSLSARVRHAAEGALAQYTKLKGEDLGITILDLTNPQLIGRADFQGDAPFYPASVIKIFFMADIFMQGKQDVPDASRALQEMIVQSDNDATAYILDVLAGTCSGPDLEGRALRRFIDQRRQINRAFERMGYDISAMAKPWSFGPFGRDRQVVGPNRENRNRLTTNGTASLMLWIVRGRAPSSTAMMKLLERPLSPERKDENQVKEFVGEGLPAGAKLWSKAGWTSEVRHDAAYIELPGGKKYVLVIFTRGQAADKTLLPAVTRLVLDELTPPAIPTAP